MESSMLQTIAAFAVDDAPRAAAAAVKKASS
jgi:hypothetical protein